MQFFKPVLFFLIFLSSSALTSQVTISGNALTYAGSEISFRTNADPFTGEETELGKCTVTANGDFSLVLPMNGTTYIFSHVGVFKGHLVAEPGKSYGISFPDKTDKTAADIMNPFFKEKEFQFIIKNATGTDLNSRIKAFDDVYNPHIDSIARHIYARNIKKIVDTSITVLQKISENSNSIYFKNYTAYKIGYLRSISSQQKSKSTAREFFQNRQVLLNNIAYLSLLNQTYTRYFYFFGRTATGKQIFTDININKSYSGLIKTLLTDSILKNDSLRELVILKNIHDEFYAANFSRSGLLAILDSLASTTKILQYKEFAGLIRKKITRLMPGYEPPTFSLYNKDGKLIRLEDFKGKYIYLNFCACSSYSCLKEFDVLKKISEKYKDYKLVVITISTDDTREQMANWVTKNQPNWQFVHFGNQPEILKQYDIRAYPTYFLIGTDGKLILSPANSPGENFEMELFKIMRSKGDA